MLILISIIALHFMVLLAGKYTRRVNYLGYLLVGFLTIVQVGLVVYLLFTMEVPSP